jgi:hypothetical protein
LPDNATLQMEIDKITHQLLHQTHSIFFSNSPGNPVDKKIIYKFLFPYLQKMLDIALLKQNIAVV